ncbi:MAG: hypothetical protein ACR2JY_20470 [Chloroflexota bacterium]
MPIAAAACYERLQRREDGRFDSFRAGMAHRPLGRSGLSKGVPCTVIVGIVERAIDLSVLARREARLLHESLDVTPFREREGTGRAGRRLLVPELARSAAVQLFVQRARAVQPSFTLTADTARLEGAYGTTSLQVLVDSAADLPERQRTLRATLAWSYDLLAPDEQQLFRQLAVFAGGCTLEAAETVCGHGAGRDVLAGLASLLDKGLLWRAEGADGAPRLGMLETVREYALERLETSGEVADPRRWHAAYYLAAAERAEPGLTGPAQAACVAR